MIIHLYMYVLYKVIYVLTTETVWPKNPQVFTLWPFTEVCGPFTEADPVHEAFFFFFQNLNFPFCIEIYLIGSSLVAQW